MSRKRRAKAARLAATPATNRAETEPRLWSVERRQIQAARRRRRLRSLALRGLVVTGVSAFIVLFALAAGIGQPDIGRAAGIEGSAAHVPEGQPLPQRNRPPSSGPHYGARAPYGVSSSPIEPGYWIHALEHGGIVILFRCDSAEACATTARQIDEQVYARARDGRFGERKLVITPYQEIDYPIVAVAWGRVLELDGIDPVQLLAFYDRYVDRGPENVR